jgi:hypothetical protein
MAVVTTISKAIRHPHLTLGNETRSGGIVHLSGSNADGGNHEVPPFGLPDATAVAPPPCVSRAGAETTPSISNDPYVPSVAASGPPRVTQRAPSPPKRTISDSPSPCVPSVYSSNTNTGRYAPPPPPAQKPILNIDPPTSGSYSHYQPLTETFIPPRHEPSSLAFRKLPPRMKSHLYSEVCMHPRRRNRRQMILARLLVSPSLILDLAERWSLVFSLELT